MLTVKEIPLSLCLNFGVLGFVLTAAIWHDVRTLRVPNYIVVLGTLAALLLHGGLAGMAGTDAASPQLGLAGSITGFLVGFFAFLPFYLVRAAGAGDVKLMAMVGAFVGPLDMIVTYVWTCAAGALFSLLLVWRRGLLRRMLANTVDLLRHAFAAHLAAGSLEAGRRMQPATVARLPYSLAIAAGTAMWMTMRLAP